MPRKSRKQALKELSKRSNNVMLLRAKYGEWADAQLAKPVKDYITEVDGVQCAYIPVDMYNELMGLHKALLDARRRST